MTVNQIWAAIALAVVWVVCFRGAIRAHREYRRLCAEHERIKERQRREAESLEFAVRLHREAADELRRCMAIKDWGGFWVAVKKCNIAYVRVCREAGAKPNQANIIPGA